MSNILLTDEECMVELTELGDRARGGEDIRWDKVSEVIKRAQLKKVVEFIGGVLTEGKWKALKGESEDKDL